MFAVNPKNCAAWDDMGDRLAHSATHEYRHWDTFWRKAAPTDSCLTSIVGYGMNEPYDGWRSGWASQRALGELVDPHVNPRSSTAERRDRGKRASCVKLSKKSVSE